MVMDPFRGGAGYRVRRATSLLWAGRLLAAAAILMAALATAGDTRADSVAHSAYARHAVAAAALKTTVPPELALAVARVGGTKWLYNGNDREAVGVMGLRPSLVAAEFGVGRFRLQETSANAGLGVALLERLYRRHGERWALALSHYRGGPLGRCGNEAVIHADTIDFVADVMEWWRRYQNDEDTAVLIEQIRSGRYRGDRFTINDDDFYHSSTNEFLYEGGSPLSEDAGDDWMGGSWIAVSNGASRFRHDDLRLHGPSGSARFF